MKLIPINLKWRANFAKKSFWKNKSQLNFNKFLINYQWVMKVWGLLKSLTAVVFTFSCGKHADLIILTNVLPIFAIL